MKQGLVMSIDRNKAVVLTKNGVFEEVWLKRNSQLSVGDELQQHHIYTFSLPKIKLWYPVLAACMAVVLFFVTTSGIFQKDAVAAYISLDVNPSIEAGIDQHMQIISVKALNQDATALLNNPQTYKHKSLQAFLSDLVTQLKNKGYLTNQPDVLVTSAFTQDIKNKSQFEKEVQQAIDYISKTKDMQKSRGQLTYVKTTVKNHDLAEKAGVSTGKYLVYLNASKKDPNISLDKVKKSSIKEIKLQMHETATLNLVKPKKNNNGKDQNNKTKSAQTESKNNPGNHLGQIKKTGVPGIVNNHSSGKGSDQKNGKGNGNNKGNTTGQGLPSNQNFGVEKGHGSNQKTNHGTDTNHGNDSNHGKNYKENYNEDNHQGNGHSHQDNGQDEQSETHSNAHMLYLKRIKAFFDN